MVLCYIVLMNKKNQVKKHFVLLSGTVCSNSGVKVQTEVHFFRYVEYAFT